MRGLALGAGRATARAHMREPFPDLVSTDWLANRLGDPALAILDATRHLPSAQRAPRAEFETAHIPGARFLDLASLVDKSSEVPQALPSPYQLAERLRDLGVPPDAEIVVYDDSAVRTSARAWFMLTASGFPRVAILDGGLAKWRAEDRQMDSGISDRPRAAPTTSAPIRRVATKAEMLANLREPREQVLDARSADRVFGHGDDPVHGGANGRIPGSLNLPYPLIFAENGTYLPPGKLRAAFERAGIDWDRPIVTTCGSGITACVLLFAAHLAGKDDLRLYDGSWMEWGADPTTPKAQGPA